METMGKTKPTVIVEIGNDWLKIAEGSTSRSGISILRSSFKKLAQIKEPIAQVFGHLWKEHKFSKHNVIAYIPRQLITVRILELPSTNMAEIADMINLQIGKQTPYSKDEITFTYQVIDTTKEGYTKVMLVIAKRNIVNERLEILNKAGITPRKITLSSEGVYHWFKAFYLGQFKHEGAQAVMLVDVDSNYSDFMLFLKGKLAFTKNILIGANHLAQEGVGSKEKFIDELMHSKELCQEEYRGIKPVKIFFSGAVKDVKPIIPSLDRLDVPCEVIDAAKDVDIKADPAVSVSSILGLLLKGQEASFNLMPGEMRIQKVMEAQRKDLTMVGVLLCAIVMVLSLLVFMFIDQKTATLAQIRQKLADIRADSDKVDQMRSSVRIVKQRLDARGDCLNLLKDIYKVLPDKMYLTSISIERKGRIGLKGRAMAMSEVFKFTNQLEGVPDFKSVQNTYATTNKESDEQYNTEFEITAVYNDKG